MGRAGLVLVCKGMAVEERIGKVWSGEARHGMERQQGMGLEWKGEARRGAVRQ